MTWFVTLLFVTFVVTVGSGMSALYIVITQPSACHARNYTEYIHFPQKTDELLIEQDGKGCVLEGVDFRDAVFREVDFRGAVFKGTELLATDFRGSDFQGADFDGAELWDTDFRGADLREANFFGAKRLRGLKLEGAKTDGAVDLNFE